MVTFANLQQTESDLQADRETYLRRFGWKMTCNVPGSFWLWQRDFVAEDAQRHARWRERGPGPMGWPSEPKPYGRITAPLEIAVRMTRSDLDVEVEECVED